MLIGQFRYHTTTWSTLDKTLHDEERLVDLLHRSGILANSGSDSGNAHRTSAELVDDGQQDAVINLVQSLLVDIQCFQRYLGNL